MPFIPNAADAFHESQASPDSGHFETLRAGSKATGVVSGCAVTAQGTPDMTVAVASGVIAWEGIRANVTAGNLTLTADGTDPRFYLIVASSAGVKSAVAGTPAPEMDPPTVAGPVFPAIPSTSVVLASVYVPAADTDIDANQIDDMRVFVVPPAATTNYDLSKALSIPLVKERSQTVTLAAGRNLIHGFLRASGKLFAITQTAGGAYFIRFNNPEDLTDQTEFQFANDGLHNSPPAMVYVAETDRIYVLFSHASRVQVSSVNPSTHAVVDVINDTTEIAGTLGGMTADSANLYVTTFQSPSRVLKYRLSDFTLVGSVTLTGRNNGHAILYDGQDVYAVGGDTGTWVAKVDPAAMTYTDTTLSGTAVPTDDLTSAGDYIWIGREGASGNNLFRVSKADLTIQEAVWAEADVIYAVYFDGTYVWVAHGVTPGKISRVDPHSGQTSIYTFPTGENLPNEIVSDGTRLFVTFYLSPAKVKRFMPSLQATNRLGTTTQIQVGGSVTPGSLIAVRTVEHVTDGNAGSSEETLGTAALTANTLSADKKALRLMASGKFAANANAKRILLKFGLGSPVTVFDSGSLLFNDANWWLDALCVRTGANAQKWTCKWTSDSSLLATDVTPPVLTTQTDTGAINILVRGDAQDANDVTCELLLVEMIN